MCGNWGLLALALEAEKARKSSKGLLPEGLEAIIKKVMSVVEMRGAQAGGLTLIVDPRVGGVPVSCRVRAVKPKRGNLPDRLFGCVHRQLWWNSFLKMRMSQASSTVMVAGHSRFGTSSAPAVIETHPHQWSPTTTQVVWKRDTQSGWLRQRLSCMLAITHNGDFDAWKPFRSGIVDVETLGLWLERVLGHSNCAKGDSPKVAGVMELLVCQGVWFYAVRCAYHLDVAVHIEQASAWTPLHAKAPCTVPSPSVLQAWANVFDREFASIVNKDGVVGPEDPLSPASTEYNEFVERVSKGLLSGTASHHLMEWMHPGQVKTFVVATCKAFRDNDPFNSLLSFLRRADGTFGITVSSTVFPDSIVLAARGQPLSVGFGGSDARNSTSLAVWTSERAALKALAPSGSTCARMDLDDAIGEVVQLTACTFTKASRAESSAVPSFEVALGRPCASEGKDFLRMRGLHFGSGGVEAEDWQPIVLDRRSFRKRLVWLVGSGRDSFGPSASDANGGLSFDGFPCDDDGGETSVAADVADIPHLISEVDKSWSYPGSLNRISAEYFALRLVDSLGNRDGGPRRIDVLCIGIEGSLWLAQQFCADLSLLFPRAHAVAMSSNSVLGLLQAGPGHVHPANWTYGRGSFDVDDRTLVLAVSHSGTTYSTVWAARCLRARTPHVFGMSSSFDSLLAESIGQLPSQIFTKRLFSSLAGIRPMEAASAATITMHHTLSHLLVCCAAQATKVTLPSLMQDTRQDIVNGDFGKRLKRREVDAMSIACDVTPSEVVDMHRLLHVLYWGACSACGVDEYGQSLHPRLMATHRELLRAGHAWSHHITEGYWATFLPAGYVIITVVSGFLPASQLCNFVLDIVGAKEGDEPYAGVVYAMRAIDAAIYVFLPILVAMVHRYFTGRRLWARFTTRTLVLVESTVNYKLLRAYVSKLLALSWRFATMGVVGQNGMDHFVHEYTHKAQSDALVAVGIPDGRVPSAAAAEACVQMSMQQAKFIKPTGKGVHICSLGHNPFIRPGLFTISLRLPTRRPLFASEKALLYDMVEPVEGGLASARPGISPALLMQRWVDITRKTDPMSLPRVQFTMADLRALVAPRTELHIDSATEHLNRIVYELLAQMKEKYSLRLGLKRFVYYYVSGFPESSYATEDDGNSSDEDELSTSPAEDDCNSSDEDELSNVSQPETRPDTMRDNARLSEEGDVILEISSGREKKRKLQKKRTVQADIRDVTVGLPMFMAMVHSDELQRWVRRRLQAERRATEGLAPLAGVKRISFGQEPTMRSEVSNISAASAALQEDAERACRRSSMRGEVFEQDFLSEGDAKPGATGAPIGQQFEVHGVGPEQLFALLQRTEQFFENRVASAERLIAWFVLFHAMVEPSSRLPFLNYEMGKTESRLRVASTPAPVPMIGGSMPSGVDENGAEEERDGENEKDECMMRI